MGVQDGCFGRFRLHRMRHSTSSGRGDIDHEADMFLQRLTVRLITWLRVERCSICQVVATRCLWLVVHHEQLSRNNLVSIRTLFPHSMANLLQTHAWVAVLHDTTRSATSATHALSPGRTYKTSTPASDMYHREAQMRPNKLCRRRDGWRHSARESCATTTKSSSIIEVGLPLLYNTNPIVSILCTQRSTYHSKFCTIHHFSCPRCSV